MPLFDLLAQFEELHAFLRKVIPLPRQIEHLLSKLGNSHVCGYRSALFGHTAVIFDLSHNVLSDSN